MEEFVVWLEVGGDGGAGAGGVGVGDIVGEEAEVGGEEDEEGEGTWRRVSICWTAGFGKLWCRSLGVEVGVAEGLPKGEGEQKTYQQMGSVSS